MSEALYTAEPAADAAETDPVVIALIGRAGSGKTSIAEHLADQYDFLQVAFADELRMMLAQHLERLQVDHAWLTEPARKDRPIEALPGRPTARALMQELGSLFRRHHPDWWVHALACSVGLPPPHTLRTLAASDGAEPGLSCAAHDRIVITDVRYPNELDWVLDIGARVLHVVREQAAPVRSHESEAHIDCLATRAHAWLRNDGPTLTGLRASVDAQMREWRIPPREGGLLLNLL